LSEERPKEEGVGLVDRPPRSTIVQAMADRSRRMMVAGRKRFVAGGSEKEKRNEEVRRVDGNEKRERERDATNLLPTSSITSNP